MKKKLYFTNAAPPEKTINSINTYVNLTYDTTEKKLYLYDSFGGELKKYEIGMTEVSTTSGATSGTVDDGSTTSGAVDPDAPTSGNVDPEPQNP